MSIKIKLALVLTALIAGGYGFYLGALWEAR